jgi:membrane-associated phospholipid phosphatase
MQNSDLSLKSAQLWIFPLIAFSLAGIFSATDLNIPVFLYLNGMLNSWIPSPWWAHITNGGDGFVAVAMTLPFCVKNHRFVMMLMVAGAIIAILMQVIKSNFSMQRPPSLLDQEQFVIVGKAYMGGSFPSGHTATSFFVVTLVFLNYPNKLVRCTALMIGLTVALSRIACGVHWPTDVLAGAGTGWLVSALVYYLFSRWPRSFHPKVALVLQWLPLVVISVGVSWYETTYAGTRVSFVMLCVLMIVLYLSRTFGLSRS